MAANQDVVRQRRGDFKDLERFLMGGGVDASPKPANNPRHRRTRKQREVNDASDEKRARHKPADIQHAYQFPPPSPTSAGGDNPDSGRSDTSVSSLGTTATHSSQLSLATTVPVADASSVSPTPSGAHMIDDDLLFDSSGPPPRDMESFRSNQNNQDDDEFAPLANIQVQPANPGPDDLKLGEPIPPIRLPGPAVAAVAAADAPVHIQTPRIPVGARAQSPEPRLTRTHHQLETLQNLVLKHSAVPYANKNRRKARARADQFDMMQSWLSNDDGERDNFLHPRSLTRTQVEEQFQRVITLAQDHCHPSFASSFSQVMGFILLLAVRRAHAHGSTRMSWGSLYSNPLHQMWLVRAVTAQHSLERMEQGHIWLRPAAISTCQNNLNDALHYFKQCV